ncbi:Rho GTPase activation protein, partial [Phycomyces blakesleeanus]
MLHHPFQESFWSPNAAIDPVPNFSIGLNVLHQKLHQSVEENSVIVQYLRRRIAAEQGYADLLLALAPNDSLNTAFERDVGASLKKSFEIVRSESGETAQGHLSRAANLTEAALDPLERLTTRYQRIVTTTKATMDKRIASFELVAGTVEQLRTSYVAKCRAVQTQDLDYIPPLPYSDLQIRLGKWAFTYREITRVLYQMQEDYPAVKTHVFDSSPDRLYRIHKQPLSGLKGSTLVRKYDPAKPGFDESKTPTPGAFGGIFERWNHKHHEEYRQIAIQEMFEADKIYKEAVRKAERMRMETEQILFMHYEEMESLELERIQTIKQEMYDRMMLYQETLRPDKDVRFIVEQYRTGRYCPRPIIYQNHFHGPASGQVFGISLEELARARQLIVPPLISQGLVVIESGFTKLYDEEKNKAWTTQLPLDRVHAAREEVNHSPVAMTADYLRRYDVLLLASLIRLFLMEIPECLLTFELYEPFKLIYTNWTQDDESRLVSITKLLATLPTTNYYTLKTLMKHFHKLFKESDDEHNTELLDNLATTFGHILIRPQIETTIRIYDKHPQRLLRDLIKSFDDIFFAEAYKIQTDHSNRRPGVTNTDSSSKEPSLDAPSFSSTLSSTTSVPNSSTT